MITGEQVKTARKLLGWSQVQLAMKTRLGKTTVCLFEKGERRLSTRTQAEIRYAFAAAGLELPKFEPPRQKAERHAEERETITPEERPGSDFGRR